MNRRSQTGSKKRRGKNPSETDPDAWAQMEHEALTLELRKQERIARSQAEQNKIAQLVHVMLMRLHPELGLTTIPVNCHELKDFCCESLLSGDRKFMLDPDQSGEDHLKPVNTTAFLMKHRSGSIWRLYLPTWIVEDEPAFLSVKDHHSEQYDDFGTDFFGKKFVLSKYAFYDTYALVSLLFLERKTTVPNKSDFLSLSEVKISRKKVTTGEVVRVLTLGDLIEEHFEEIDENFQQRRFDFKIFYRSVFNGQISEIVRYFRTGEV